MTISKRKLADLHEYISNGGSEETEDIAAVLGTDDEQVVSAYMTALKKRYASESTPEASYFLFDPETNLTKELELLRKKDNKVYLQVIEPKDLVMIKVGGEELEVDLIKLRKKDPSEKIGGHLVSTLIVAAELAKG